MNITKELRFACILVIAGSLSACGGSCNSDPDPTSDMEGIDTDMMVTPGEECTPDPALIDARRECQTTDDCVCGTHCELGVCVASCTDDADCTGDQVCDQFGSCRAPEEANTPEPLPTNKPGRLLAESPQAILNSDQTRTISFDADGAITRSRVVARRGSEVRCPGTQEFATECELTDVADGEQVAIEVRHIEFEIGDENGIPGLDVYTGQGKSSVSLPATYQIPGFVSDDDRQAMAAPLEGRYSGRIQLRGAGSSDELDTWGNSLGFEVGVDVNVWKSESGYVIEIDDPLDLFTVEPTYVGTLTDNAGELSVSFPDHLLFQEQVNGRDETIASRVHQSTVTSTAAPRRLTIALLMNYATTTASTERQPTTRWVLELGREGETSQDMPVVPQDVEVEADIEPSPTAFAVAGLVSAPYSLIYTTNTNAGYGITLRTNVKKMNEYLHSWYLSDDVLYIGMAFLGAGSSGQDDAHLKRKALANLFANAFLWPGISTIEQSEQLPLPQNIVNTLNLNDVVLKYGERHQYDGITTPAHPFVGWTREDAIPCAFSGKYSKYWQVDPNLPPEIRTASLPPNFTMCHELAERIGCVPSEPGEIQVHDVRRGLAITDRETGPNARAAILADLQVNRVCTLPTIMPRAAEAALCYSPTVAPPTTDGLRPHPYLLGSELSGAEDLRCERTQHTLAFPIDEDSTLTGAQMLDACLAETAALAQAVESGATLDEIINSNATCVELGRLRAATDLLIANSSHYNTYAPIYSSSDPSSIAIWSRLMSRWMSLHSYYANEGLQRAYTDIALKEVDSTIDSPTPRALYDASLQGWGMLLNARQMDGMMNIPGDLLVDPDYRFMLFDIVDRNSEQNDALAGMIYDTIARQAKLARNLLERTSPSTTEERFEVVASLMRRTVIAQALAATMNARAAEADPDYLWKDRHDNKLRRASSAMGELMGMVDSIRSGSNPLGITDEDLPLYYDTRDASDAASKFGAMTEFLLGENAASGAWAPAAVAQAEDSLMQAREAYLQEEDRRLRDAHGDRDFLAWVEDVEADYNAQIRDFCGPLDGSPVTDPNFSPTTCMINPTDECAPDYDVWYSSTWTQDDIKGRFCLHSQFKTLTDSSGFANQPTVDFYNACSGAQDMSANTGVKVEACANTPGKSCLKCETNNLEELVLQPGTLDVVFPDTTQANVDAQEGSYPEYAPYATATNTCIGHFPAMRVYPPLPSSPLDKPGCVRGSIGSAYLDIVAAAGDLEGAQAQVAEFTEAYDIAYKSCTILADSNEKISQLEASHAENMKGLHTSKGVADGVAATAAGVKECAATTAGADVNTPWGAAKSAIATTASCVAGATETASTLASIGLETEIEKAQATHDNAVAQLELQAEVDICFNDARQELVGLHTAMLDVNGAAFELERAMAEVAEQLADLERLQTEGYAYVAEIKERQVPDPSGDPWANERVTRYVNDFKLARRAAYLAVRAVEYEYQTTLSVRQEVFDAETPTDLRQNVLNVLWQDANARRINGNSPSNLTAVVSLRDDILRLNDESIYPEEMLQLSPAERLHIFLSDPRFAVYNEAGTFAGVQLPFTLAPLGALGFDTQGVPIYAKTDCAERLWSINASILGDDLLRDSNSTNVRIDILKQNTFFSQWCGDRGANTEFQHASYRPNTNLFREPGIGANVGASTGVERGVESYSRARVQAYLNVPRNDFDSADYDDGQSNELAARGLYGNYAIFIPADLISRDNSQGLVLNHIDDILIRLDYVSVAAP